jgi:pilus assembly protein CpaE
MMKPSTNLAEQIEGAEPAFENGQATLEKARPIPRISIQAFCEEQASVDAMHAATQDRRLAKSHVSVHMGGAQAAVRHYLDSPTPNLIVIETSLGRDQLLGELDRLAECCDAGTKVIIVGRTNDVALYRELLRRGVSDYLISPIDQFQFLDSLSNIYNNPETDPVGNVIAFIGAKGGVGSSTICHNVAWAMSQTAQSNVIVADFDLPFGTTGLDFNQDPVQGIADALLNPDRLDEVLLDRLLTKCTEQLSIFAAPVVLDRDYDITSESCNAVIDVIRQHVPYVVLDLPHMWTDWVKSVLFHADEIVITAIPDLANLRNAKNLVDMLKAKRPNDAPPKLVLNMAKMPKRPEIAAKEFATALGIQPLQIIEFDSEAFGQSANNGQMIEEHSPKAKAAPQFRELANAVAHRREIKAEPKKASASALAPLLEKFKIKL